MHTGTRFASHCLMSQPVHSHQITPSHMLTIKQTPSEDAQYGSRPKVDIASIKQALGTQIAVIYALVMRETKTRYGDHKIGFLWAFIEPMTLILVLTAMYKAMGTQEQSGMPMIVFMTTGFLSFMIFRDTMTQLINAISANQSLLAFPQVTTFDVIMARALLELAVLITVLVIILLGASIFGDDIRVENPLGVIAAIGLLWITGLGLGFMVACLAPILPSIKQLMTSVMGRPLLLTSGIFYTSESLPPPIRNLLLHNPLLHMIELMRSSYFYSYESRYASWSYASLSAIFVLAFGLLVHQAMRRRAIVGL